MMARKKAYYRGIRMDPYDLVKELLVALAVVSVVVLLLSIVLSSPDEPPVTIQGVAQASPQTYVQTSLDSLDGNSPVAGCVPNYAPRRCPIICPMEGPTTRSSIPRPPTVMSRSI